MGGLCQGERKGGELKGVWEENEELKKGSGGKMRGLLKVEQKGGKPGFLGGLEKRGFPKCFPKVGVS